LAWQKTVLAWPVLYAALAAAYYSLLPQLLLAIFLFSYRNMTGRVTDLLWSAALAIVATTFISVLWPVLGPCAPLGGECAPYLPDLIALRTGGPWHFDLSAMQGIVQMPSYHVVLGVLLAYAFRNTGLIGWCVAGLNGFMLLSVPPIGGHYVADMIAGSVLAIACILILRMASRFRQSASLS
ncbi:MAG: phosphatase PAP2 family protein, partial [Janthinobacterium lividum]